MSVALILDAEAVTSRAGRRSASFGEVQAALKAARRLRRDVVVPAVILAELYRGPRRSQVVDSHLSRQASVTIRDTDRDFARYVGAVLVAAGADLDDIADAHVVGKRPLEAGEEVEHVGGFEDAVSLPAHVALAEDAGVGESVDRVGCTSTGPTDERGSGLDADNWCTGENRQQEIDAGVRPDPSKPLTPTGGHGVDHSGVSLSVEAGPLGCRGEQA